MILEKETFEKFGYLPSERRSRDIIISECDKCGCLRESTKNHYRAICCSCAVHSEERNKKISIALTGIKRSDKTKKKIGEVQKGRHPTEAAKQKMSLAKKGKAPYRMTEEIRQNMSVAHKGKPLSKRCKRNKSIAAKKHWDEHPELKEKMSKNYKKKWSDYDFVKKMMKARNTKPNKLEQLVNGILQKKYPDEGEYNGDFSCGVALNGLIPDFINVNGKKAVIEVFGDVYHDEKKTKRIFGDVLSWKRTEWGRKAIFAQLGYRCVILWEEKIKREGEEYIIKEVNAYQGI